MVFIHGIGIGLYPYTNFLDELNSTTGIKPCDSNDQVGIIALELMPVSFRLTRAALSREALCEEINHVVTACFGPTQKFVLVSHSYGTVITTHLLKSPPISQRIGPIVLIDPVTILLHLPDVAYNFTRRKPMTANELQLHYFASMDMGVSHTLGRHFFWSENILWREDLGGRKVTVSLSGRDLIVNTEAVGEYLSAGMENNETDNRDRHSTLEPRDAMITRRNVLDKKMNSALSDKQTWKTRAWRGDERVEVLWWPDLDHAQVFDKPASRKKVLDVIRSYCEA